MKEKLPFEITKVSMDEKNRMLRAGLGKHDGDWFFRVDFWKVGYRITKKKK